VDEKQEQSILNISSEFSNAAHSMYKALEQTIAVDNRRTLEDLTRELLLPMLKTWLDENLPTIVERLVRAEIDRVSKPRSHSGSANSEKTD
jgi:uncharacterized protein